MLSDCIAKERSETELFILRSPKSVAMARAGRDRFSQAVLSLDSDLVRADAELDEVLDDPGFKKLIAAFGVGIEIDPNDDFLRLPYLRYGKIVIVLDESPPGTLIETQVLSLMNRYTHSVVAAGHVYTVSIGDPERTSEEEFFKEVLCPETRKLKPVAADPDSGALA